MSVALAEQVKALRSSAGLSHGTHIAIIRVEGQGALDFLQGASTQSPYVREGRVRHTLFLRDDASVLADAFMVNVEDGFLILAEGPTEEEMVAWLSTLRDRCSAKEVTIRGMQTDWVTLGIDGPYAWEVVAGVLGPAALGMPYLSLLRRDELLCLRAGKTGEYGYLLLAAPAVAGEVEAKILEVGAPLDLVRVTREALDVCALENWHFSMRNLGKPAFAAPLTPIELQLQWRVVYTREFVGGEALRARRAEGPKVRVTCFTSERAVEAGQRLRLEKNELDVGEVLGTCASPTLGLTVGSALLDVRFAHPHLTLSTTAPGGSVALRTCTASLVDNVSLHVLPHKDSYATRNAVEAKVP